MNKEVPTHISSENSRAAVQWGNPRTNERRGLLTSWYNLTSPMEPRNATPRDREVVRYGRLSSVILLIIFCLGVALLPSAIISVNHAFLPILLCAMLVNVGVVLLNRQGRIIAVGLIMVVVVEMAFVLIVLTGHGLSTRSLPTFDLIVVTELLAVSLLPPRSVFPVTLCNCLFTWSAITFLPHTADLTYTTAGSYYNLLMRPIALQIIVAVVTYLWVRGAAQAIERAEQVAALEHAMAEQDRIIAEQKQQLDMGIQQILQTHVQIANGNFNVRAPLSKDNVLWQVAHNLNNLLARLQRAVQSETELKRTHAETALLVENVRYAKSRHTPVRASRTGTLLDPLAQEITGHYINQP